MEKLYRYRPFNENTLRELVTGELWHSHVRLLNDPFEHPFEFDWDEINENKLYEINKHLRMFPDDIVTKHFCDGEQNELVNQVEKWLESQYEDLSKNARSTFVCCFSEDGEEPLMWSHYADGMKGICVVYDRRKLESHSKIKLKPADYNKEVKKVTFRDFEPINFRKLPNQYSFSKGKIMAFVEAGSQLKSYRFSCQKHERWEYEKELRSVLFAENDAENEKSGVVIDVGADAIIGVIIGGKMNSVNREIVETLCAGRNIEVKIAKPNKQDYSVDIKSA